MICIFTVLKLKFKEHPHILVSEFKTVLLYPMTTDSDMSEKKYLMTGIEGY